MDEETRSKLQDLLADRSVLALAVEVDGAPYAGALPFAVRREDGAFLVHASRLARHTRGLMDGSPFALVVQAAETEDADPLQLPRLMLQGTVSHLAKDGQAYAQGRDLYTARFPQSAPIFGLGDFDLYALVPERGRFVTGFAGSHGVTPEVLRALDL